MNLSEDLEQIRRSEKSKKLFKGYFTYTSIQPTASIARVEFYSVKPESFAKDFHPSPVRRIVIIFVAGFILFSFFGLLLQDAGNIYVLLFALPFAAGGIFLFYDAFINPKKNYAIHLDFEGITLSDELFVWRDIRETAILQMGQGRNEVNFLILVLNDGSYRKFNLQAFATLWGFRNAISAYVEYFKSLKTCFLLV